MLMRSMLRWWETLGRPERIVAMSLAVGGTVAITNSAIWAIAVSYMAHQKTIVALATARSGATVTARTEAATPPARAVAPENTPDRVPLENGPVYSGS